jgi:hypothetical protein
MFVNAGVSERETLPAKLVPLFIYRLAPSFPRSARSSNFNRDLHQNRALLRLRNDISRKLTWHLEETV